MSKVTFTKTTTTTTTTTTTSEFYANITTTEVNVYDTPFEDYERLIACSKVTRKEFYPKYRDCLPFMDDVETTKVEGSCFSYAVTSGLFYSGNGVLIEIERMVLRYNI